MATFKIGDRVVCMIDGFTCSRTNCEYQRDPKKGDILTVNGIEEHFGKIYLEFEEIPPTRGEREQYISIAFRKVIHDFRSEETAELVRIFKENQLQEKELQEDELKIFTTTADF